MIELARRNTRLAAGHALIRRGLLVTSVLVATAPLALRAAEAPESGESAASDIVVNGHVDADSAAAGTKSSLPLVETPQAISVMTAEDLARLGTANLDEALRQVAGVTPETRGANDGLYDLFKLRGFDAPVYLDGLREFASSTGYASPQVDVSRIDRIEVLKGPSSALYGATSPGGLVALTSKLPLDQAFYGSTSATYGTDNLYRLDADVGGKLTPDLAVRLSGSANGSDTQQSFGRRERETLSGAVTWRLDSATSLTVLGAWSHDPANGNYGSVPASGSLFANPNGVISSRFADGEPGDYFRRNQGAATYILTHDFGNGWGFRSAGRWQSVTTHLGAIYQTGIATDDTQTTFERASYASAERLNNWTFDNRVSGTLMTGPITHEVLVGIDRQTAHSTERAAFGSATAINVYNPVYGTDTVPLDPSDITANPSVYTVAQSQTGLYGEDTMRWGGLRLVLAGRHDWARTDDGTTVQNDRRFTGRVGLLYRTKIGFAPYVSWATSFEPQSGQVQASDGSISSAKPSLGKQFEAGVKFQPAGSALLISADWFHIEQTNLLTAIPSSSYSTQSGKVRSEGFEIEGKVPLPAGFSFTGALSHQKVRTIADDETPSNIGTGLIGVGDGNMSARLDWTAKSGRFAGLSLGAGLRHVEHVYGGVVDGVQTYTPAYTLTDALVSYDLGAADARLKGLRLSANVTNVFDRQYLTSCYLNYFAWCWYGQRRTAQATVSWSW